MGAQLESQFEVADTPNAHASPPAASAADMGDVVERLWRRPGFLIRRCMQQISGVFEQATADMGLTARQYDYLFVLDAVGALGQGEIGEALGLDRSTNTLVLKILERKKWVVREVVAMDTRRRVVRITPAGREAFAHGREAAQKAVACISGAITHEEYATLVTIMRKIVQANLTLPALTREDKAGDIR